MEIYQLLAFDFDQLPMEWWFHPFDSHTVLLSKTS